MFKKIHNFLWKIKIILLEKYRKSKNKEILKLNKKFLNIHKDEDCFIVCNGPSLSIKDLERINCSGIKTFGCNKILKLFNETDWRPDYYCVCDPKLFQANKDQIINVIDGVKNNVFIPLDMKDNLGNDKINYFSRVPFQLFNEKPRFSNNMCKSLIEGGSVTYFMLQIAAYMGFKNIFLIGCDFNFSTGIDINGKIFVNNAVKNHSEFTGGNTLDTLPNLKYNLMAYKSAKKYSEKKRINIYNATRGGKLEVFQRVSLDEILK